MHDLSETFTLISSSINDPINIDPGATVASFPTWNSPRSSQNDVDFSTHEISFGLHASTSTDEVVIFCP